MKNLSVKTRKHAVIPSVGSMKHLGVVIIDQL